LPVCPPRLWACLPSATLHVDCKSWCQCRNYARFRIFVVLKEFENFWRANCLFAPPGCGSAYHQLNNIACKLLKLVPVQKLYHIYARFVKREVQGGNPLQIYSPLEKCVGHSQDIVKKIWVTLKELCVAPGVPSWLQAWSMHVKNIHELL